VNSRRRLSVLVSAAIAVLGVLAAILVGTVTSRADPAGPVTIATSADAFVSSAQPDANRGDAPWVTSDASPLRYGFFRFEVALPADVAVTHAEFRCVAGSSNAAGALVWPASSDWNEGTITWSNAPLPDRDGAPAASTGPVRRNEWASADLTGQVPGSGTYTFVTGTDSRTAWSCAARENSRNTPAVLVLTTVPTVPVPTTEPPSMSTPAPTTSTPAPSTATPAPSTATPAPTTSTPAPSTSSPVPPPPATGHKLLVIPLENHSQSEALAQMPNLAGWAQQFGQATSYYAITHPSLPNYLAIFGGSTFGVTSDCSVGSSGCVPAAPSVWGQTLAAGHTAAAYQESMTSDCQTGGSGSYAPRHGPWPYWTDAGERAACQANDVPSGTATSGRLVDDIRAGALPTTGELTPNLCNDGHDCGLATTDAWLATWMPVIMAGPDYVAGRLTVVITFDEDDASQNNKVALVVIDPRLHGVDVTGTYDHYSLTRWLDDNAGVALLRNAALAPDLRAAFGL
jgi:phosphatidylinositol-3-phosphatase